MFSRAFWIKTAERAVKTAAQFTLVALGGNFVNAWELDVAQASGAAVAGAIVSVLTSIVSTSVGDSNDPSAVDPNPYV